MPTPAALPPESYESYVQLVKLKNQIKEAKRKLESLETDKKLLETNIITGPLKRKGSHARLLPTGRILKITRVDIKEQIVQPEDVGTIKRQGYSYFRMSEE